MWGRLIGVVALVLMGSTVAGAGSTDPAGHGVFWGPGRPVPLNCVDVTAPPAKPGTQIRCPVVPPPGTTEIAGWSGWTLILTPQVTYASVKLWHDGGTPHKIHDHISGRRPDALVVGPGLIQQYDLIPAFTYTGPGHAYKLGDAVFVDFYCVGAPNAFCAAEGTFHFRVP
jgi:hypothetical protein